MSARAGVLLMTYGAPSGDADLPDYLSRVRGGNVPSAELVAEFRRRYAAIGGSPLVRITEAQAGALEALLGSGFVVRAGMRFSPPFVADRVFELADSGIERLVAICLSPQWSDRLMGGYVRAVEEGIARVRRALPFAVARAWHREPAFAAALAERIIEARTRLADDDAPAIVFTAHSLPRRVFDAEPGYVEDLRETAALVAARAGLAHWEWAYQSAGHTQEEWLRPDLKELFPGLAAAGHRRVLVVPVQFLADHLEVLYDLDVAAAAEARAAGLEFHRIEMPNTHGTFIRALAAVAERELAATAMARSDAARK